MNESWQIDPGTRDFVQVNGSPVATDSLTNPAFYRLRIPRGGWMYAPDDQYGSDFGTVRKRFNGADIAGLVNIAQQALQPIIDDGRATSVTIIPATTQTGDRSMASFQTDIVDNQGNLETLILPPLTGET